MPGNNSLLSQHKFLPLIISLILLLTLSLAACGTNGSTTGGSVASTPTSASTPAPTPTSSLSSADGCPNKTTVTTAPPRANVVLKSSNSNKSVDVKKGDTIEVDLAFGQRWEGPNDVSKALLTEQASGYADSTAKMCVWRFLAIGTGTAHIDFTGRALCAKGETCPQYIQAVSFTLEIK